MFLKLSARKQPEKREDTKAKAAVKKMVPLDEVSTAKTAKPPIVPATPVRPTPPPKQTVKSKPAPPAAATPVPVKTTSLVANGRSKKVLDGATRKSPEATLRSKTLISKSVHPSAIKELMSLVKYSQNAKGSKVTAVDESKTKQVSKKSKTSLKVTT